MELTKKQLRWKKWYESHKEEYLKKKSEYKKQYYIDNKDEILNKCKEYRKEHKEEKALKDKAYRENHQEEIKKCQKDWYSIPINRAKHLISAYIREDEKHNRGQCTLTPEELVELFLNGCLYCGEKDINKLGADRIDNNKPHTKDNCVCSCGRCNKERNIKDFQDFYNQKFMETIID